MTAILNWLDKLGSFTQGVLGSALFALLLWLGSIIMKWISSQNKNWKRKNDIALLLKHFIHRNFVNTDSVNYFTYGYLFILKKAFQYLLAGMLLVAFAFGVDALLDL